MYALPDRDETRAYGDQSVMTATTSRRMCPVCDTELIAGESRCPNCQSELKPFAASQENSADFYNQGLDLARDGDRRGAIDKMRAALAADPELVDAHIVVGKLLAQSGKIADLEQAISGWRRARSHYLTEEQSRKIEECIRLAETRLTAARKPQPPARYRGAAQFVAGLLVLAAVFYIIGFVLHPQWLGAPIAHAGRAVGPITVPREAESLGRPPSDPAAAISQALMRPDITVDRVGDRLVLTGTVHTDAEKSIIVAAATYAAMAKPGEIDVSNLKMSRTYHPVAAKRVEYMLRLFVNKLGRSSSDPLWNASISVSGGEDSRPLIVTGNCTDPTARMEIVRLVKTVYPSANRVDTSRLVVRPGAVRPTSPQLRWANVELPPAIKHEIAPAPRVVEVVRPTTKGDQVYINLSTKTYTVQPGDTIFAITHKYGRGRSEWQDLWQSNREALQRPDSIMAGMVLKLPPGWKSPGRAADDE